MSRLAKIPTELYVCVPECSSASSKMFTNCWANLTRKDTGDGIRGKQLFSYLDGVEIGHLWTVTETGYTGAPDDMNPKTEGLHPYHIEFRGDAEFEPCKSEEIILKCDPNLASDRIVMEVTPVSGDAPLTIRVTGFIEERYLDELGNPAGKPPTYALPLDFMVYDRTSTRTLQPVKTVMSNPDGTYEIEHTFTKPGTYAVFVNFLGDDKYRSDWSNNGQTTQINALEGGELPLSFEKTVTEIMAAKGPRNYKFIRAETEPDAPTDYERAPEWDLDFGILGKYWAFRATA